MIVASLRKQTIRAGQGQATLNLSPVTSTVMKGIIAWLLASFLYVAAYSPTLKHNLQWQPVFQTGANNFFANFFATFHPVSCPLTRSPVLSPSFLSSHPVSCPLTQLPVLSPGLLSSHPVACPLNRSPVLSPSFLSSHLVSCPLTRSPVLSDGLLPSHQVSPPLPQSSFPPWAPSP